MPFPSQPGTCPPDDLSLPPPVDAEVALVEIDPLFVLLNPAAVAVRPQPSCSYRPFTGKRCDLSPALFSGRSAGVRRGRAPDSENYRRRQQ